MQFFTVITLTIGSLASLAAAAGIPVDLKRDESGPGGVPLLTHREAQEGAGDANTSFKDRFCASGYASCGRAGTDGGPGNRCAMACENFAGGAALGFCKCSTGWFPDECIDLFKYLGRHQC
ncbi:hypothetical protein EsH8_VI_001076 [Colletotrichum jinshuiense]